jgi:hypothetical protein
MKRRVCSLPALLLGYRPVRCEFGNWWTHEESDDAWPGHVYDPKKGAL